MKRQKDTTSENESQGQTMSDMLLGKSIGQVQIVPERMKSWVKAEATLNCGYVQWQK